MKIHFETKSDKPLTKPTPINCKFIFGPSKPVKITNDKGIWRRIKKENKDE